MTRTKVIINICILILVILFICNPLFASEQKKINVFVSITPQAYFVDKIGGEFVNVEVLVGPGQSPETYEPTSRQMTNLADCDIYFRIGVPFEKRLLKKLSSSMKDLNISNTCDGIELRSMDEHPDNGDIHRGTTDPHVWLDPRNAQIMGKNIFGELCKIDPGHENEYSENLKKLNNDLDSLDRNLNAILAPYKGGSFIVFHPFLGYFADRYGLKQIAVETEGKEPGARQLVILINKAKEEKVRTIFVQPQFSSKSAGRIAEAIGGRVESIDGLAYDYINNMEDIARKLAEGFKSNER